MANINKFITLDNINDIIEIFEDFLDENGVTIPASEASKIESGDVQDNDAVIYGETYSDLQFDLLTYFESLEKKGTVKNVVNSWDSEVETW